MIRYALLILIALTSCTIQAKKTSFRLVVMRHGQAQHNVEERYNSNPLSPNYFTSNLTSLGQEQAKQEAKALLAAGINDTTIARVYVSPLPRTLQTAKIMAKAGLFSENKIQIDPRLTEAQIGDLEGKPKFRHWKPEYVQMYHTETNDDIRKRIDDFYNDLMQNPPDGDVIVITHSMPAQALLSKVTSSHKKLETGQATIMTISSHNGSSHL